MAWCRQDVDRMGNCPRPCRGESLGPWEAGEEAATVCYLDGEMPAELMQQREISFGDECEIRL